MKIALIAPPFVSVPPLKYGGTERMIDYLGRELIRSGVETTLYAAGDSQTSIPLGSIWDMALFNDPEYDHANDREVVVGRVNERTLGLLDKDCDLVNTHDYDNPDLIERLSDLDIPVLVSIRHAPTLVIDSIYERFKSHTNIHFQCLSKLQADYYDPEMPYIHNGLDPEIYDSVSSVDKQNYFFSIGDMKPIKAHRTAIDLVKNDKFNREAGLSLVIAGAPIYPESIPYYETHVLPRIDVDVSSQQKEFIKAVSSGSYNFKPGEVIYFGSASDDDKRALYPHARFMQFLGGFEKSGVLEGCPGTVLESLLSGTPVLGVSGSVTDELVEEGRTGFNLKKISDAVEGTDHLLSLDPMGTRDRGVRRFSTRIMTDNYIELYKKILES